MKALNKCIRVVPRRGFARHRACVCVRVHSAAKKNEKMQKWIRLDQKLKDTRLPEGARVGDHVSYKEVISDTHDYLLSAAPSCTSTQFPDEVI